MRKIIILLSFFIFHYSFFISANAQGKSYIAHEYYTYAENSYIAGDFKSARMCIDSLIATKDMELITSAYRLLALCDIEEGNINQADKAIRSLLDADPYFRPSASDNPIFIDLVNAKINTEKGITTASRQVESIDEAPVPVTVINRGMIRNSGMQTLQEVLCLYVPGMSRAEGLESNIAMRGISGLSQENILILQDGHRLNGSSTNAEAPDFRNSLDKIQQIEVLRGPASSLYGNVALTAVVNIITQKGAKLDGGKVSGVIGTQNTYGGSWVVGGGNSVVDIMGWGSVFETDGFKHEVANGIGGTTTLYAHGFNSRPSYDIGIKGQWRKFTLTLNSQRSKQNPYINLLQFSANHSTTPTSAIYNSEGNFNVSRYPSISSNGPGITRTNHHLNLDYNRTFGRFDFLASGFVSLENTSYYNAMGDSIDFEIGKQLLQKMASSAGQSSSQNTSAMSQLISLYVKTKGVYQVLEWENISFGGQMQIRTDYDFLLGKGSAMLGIQMEHFALTDGTLFLGGNYTSEQMTSSGSVFKDGKEDVYSSYLQLKHNFSKKFILNAGLRFDHKVRFNSKKIDRLSPRISLIYKLSKQFSARASYNYSFVDAPYIYRSCIVSMFSGGEDMKPETMKSLLGGVTYTSPSKKLFAELSGYYNRISDMVTIDIAQSNGYLFNNSGTVRQAGIEATAQYNSERLFINANATWQHIISSEALQKYNGNMYGVPEFMLNTTAGYVAYSGRNKKGVFRSGTLWLRATASAQSTTWYQTTDVILSSAMKQSVSEINKVSPQLILGCGVGYEWKDMAIDLSLKNLTNSQYRIGSVISTGIPHDGRQFITKIAVKF